MNEKELSQCTTGPAAATVRECAQIAAAEYRYWSAGDKDISLSGMGAAGNILCAINGFRAPWHPKPASVTNPLQEPVNIQHHESPGRLREVIRCRHHPDVNAVTMWGCPDCLHELRAMVLKLAATCREESKQATRRTSADNLAYAASEATALVIGSIPAAAADKPDPDQGQPDPL